MNRWPCACCGGGGGGGGAAPAGAVDPGRGVEGNMIPPPTSSGLGKTSGIRNGDKWGFGIDAANLLLAASGEANWLSEG